MLCHCRRVLRATDAKAHPTPTCPARWVQSSTASEEKKFAYCRSEIPAGRRPHGAGALRVPNTRITKYAGRRWEDIATRRAHGGRSEAAASKAVPGPEHDMLIRPSDGAWAFASMEGDREDGTGTEQVSGSECHRVWQRFRHGKGRVGWHGRAYVKLTVYHCPKIAFRSVPGLQIRRRERGFCSLLLSSIFRCVSRRANECSKE